MSYLVSLRRLELLLGLGAGLDCPRGGARQVIRSVAQESHLLQCHSSSDRLSCSSSKVFFVDLLRTVWLPCECRALPKTDEMNEQNQFKNINLLMEITGDSVWKISSKLIKNSQKAKGS